MEKQKLKKLIDVSAGRVPADLVIKNCKIVDVYNGRIVEGDIALCDDLIAGVGQYEGVHVVDAKGQYAAPGFIDGHIHIESSYVSPEELGRLVVPHGTTTIIADPHEIANVCGIKGVEYMVEAAKGTALDIQMMLPSCVPATPFEHAGSVIDAKIMRENIKREGILGVGEFMNFPGVINADDEVLDKLLVAINEGSVIDAKIMRENIKREGILGVGEFMNFPGVINADDEVLDKLLVAINEGKVIDGHSPGVFGNGLNAYAGKSLMDIVQVYLEMGLMLMQQQESVQIMSVLQ